MTRKNQTDDGESNGDGTIEQRSDDLVAGLNDHGFDDVSIDTFDVGHPGGEYGVVTFGTELDSSDKTTGKRAGFEDGEPAATITIQSEYDTYAITVGYGTQRGYETAEQYAIVDTISEAVQAAKHWFENEA
ncbi:hypothetical protein [Natronorubrum texcoconense]|uniref:Uncharacterized protein n=1 Tax=Natronorubrum texcoconense TaxID=1095776 RepID=A0A1G8V8A8_9EURY|nr:hypothetical protein [Natronorubrum texcoconense]SDJ62318.1 hypothetical protein SAMN04515672_1219 [Natronorubrum texcoconense]